MVTTVGDFDSVAHSVFLLRVEDATEISKRLTTPKIFIRLVPPIVLFDWTVHCTKSTVGDHGVLFVRQSEELPDPEGIVASEEFRRYIRRLRQTWVPKREHGSSRPVSREPDDKTSMATQPSTDCNDCASTMMTRRGAMKTGVTAVGTAIADLACSVSRRTSDCSEFRSIATVWSPRTSWSRSRSWATSTRDCPVFRARLTADTSLRRGPRTVGHLI